MSNLNHNPIIKNIPLKDIKPYSNNPRKKQNITKVVNSIKEFGFQQPIVVDKKNIIIVGHSRYEAGKELGLDKVPVIIADLSPVKAKAYRIADNRINQDSEWDFSKLTLEFKDISKLDFNLDSLGFEKNELDDLIIDEVKGFTDDDAVPDKPKKPKSKLGEIYQLGHHRVMCGDATKEEDVNKLMNGQKADMVFTDPPYGTKAVSTSGVLSKKYKKDMIGDEVTSVAKKSFQLIYNLYPKSNQIWWGANHYSSILPDSKCWLVWDKNNGQSDQTDCELAWANFSSVVRQFTQSSEKINRLHPTQKPVSLIEWVIKRFKITLNVLADFFGGSGSTLIAGEKHNISTYIMELDPSYVDVIIKRWEDYTGKSSKKI